MDEWMPVITVVGGLITFVLGQLFALGQIDRQARHQRDRDREALEEARKDRSREFQRTTLLELQEAMDAYGQAVLATESASRRISTEDEWNFDLDAAMEERRAAAPVTKLVNRVKDDRLGPQWNQVANRTWDALKVKSRKDAEVAYLEWVQRWAVMHDLVRTLLKEHL